MRVLYLVQRAEQTGARSVGKRLGYALSQTTGHDVLFMVPNPLDIDHSDPFVLDGDVHVPTTDLVSAVSIVDPDVVVAHTISQELVDAHAVIRSMVPTVFRYGVNLTESHVNGTDTHLEHYLDFIRMFDAFLSPSAHATNKLRGLGIDAERIYEVHPSVDFYTHEVPDPTGRPNRIGVVARHSKVKNLPMVARAIRFYEDEFGDAPEVLVAGGIQDRYEEEAPILARHAHALSIDHKFKLTGWVDPHEVIYPTVKAVLLTSLSENFPAIFAEALAEGLPVLAPDAGWAVPPAVYTPDDPGALALELRDVLDAPREVRDLQVSNAPDGLDLNVAVETLTDALEATAERCDRYTLGAEV